MKRLTALCMVLLMVISAVACGNEPIEAPASTDVTSSDTTAAEQTITEETFSDFPTQDFNGAVVKLGDTKQYDIYRYSFREEMNGEILNDAIYTSLRNVEEKLNIKLESVLFADPEPLVNAVIAGDHTADILTGQDIKMANLALEGYLYDITDFEMLDFDKPWWPESALESFYFNNSMLLFSNYMSYFGVSRARVWFVNKQLCEDFGVEIPYQDVFDGTWTLDKLHTMISSVYIDANGNNEADTEDILGFINNNNFLCMQSSMGVKTFRSDNGGNLEFIFDVERASDVLEKMYNLIYNTKSVINVGTVNNQEVQQYFRNGTSLFYYDSLGIAETELRYSDVEYGILCTPKLNEAQEDYIAAYTDYLHGIPLTVTDTELVGHAIEALTASGYYTILPTFTDVCMTNKYVYDESSADIIRLIGEKMYIDLAYAFGSQMANIFNLLKSDVKSTDIASYYAKNESLDLELLDELNSLYGKN